ncbi:MAG: YveK family protein [Fusobacteriaceae bacterium]
MLKSVKNQLGYKNRGEYLALADIIILIRSYLPMMIALTFVSGLAGTVFVLNRAPEYRATATLMVSSGDYYSAKNIDVEQLLLDQKLAATYIEIAKSPSVLSSVIKNLNLDYGVGSLSGKIEVKTVEKTEFIEIMAQDTDPVIAMRIANETGKEFADKIKDVMTFKNIRMIEEAGIPRVPQPKKTGIIVGMFLVAGIGVALVLVILSELFYSKLRRPKEIEDILESSVLLNVPLYDDIEDLENLYNKRGGKK